MTIRPTESGEITAQEGVSAGCAGSHLGLVESYFDETAQEWSDLYRRVQRVNDLVLADRKNSSVAFLAERLPPGGRVLDAGCGAGLAALDLLERGFHVHGVDVSSKMLELAERNISQRQVPPERYALSCSDVAGLRLPPNSFDGITALGFLQYQPNELEALKELHRVLKPGGVLVITGPTRIKLSNWFGLARHYYALRAKLRRKKPAAGASAAGKPAMSSRDVLRQISPHAYSYKRFRRLLADAGFRVVRCRGHGFVNYEIIGRRLGFRGEMFLHRFLTRAAKFLPIGRFANDIIVVAEKA